MSANNGNGVTLASGKAKGAHGVAAVLRMIKSFEASNIMPATLSVVFDGLWSILLERDWTADYVVADDRVYVTVRMWIGNGFDIILRGDASRHRVKYEIEVMNYGQYVRPGKPWKMRSWEDVEADANGISTTVHSLIATIGSPIMFDEPDESPFRSGGSDKCQAAL